MKLKDKKIIVERIGNLKLKKDQKKMKNR